MTRAYLTALAALASLASGCVRQDAAEPPREPTPPVVAEAEAPPAEAAAAEAPPAELPPVPLDQFIARTASKSRGVVFIERNDPENRYSCEGFSFCGLQCLDGILGQPCSDATYRIACGRDPVYSIPPTGSASRPVRCTAEGDRCVVDHEGIHAPGYPAPLFRDTFYFDSVGKMIGFGRCPEGQSCPVDPEALHRRAKTLCAARAALEGGALEPVDRLGLYFSACADLSGESARDREQHLCGSGVAAIVREHVQQVVTEGGFDGCERDEGSLFRCWVYGTEAWTVYHFDDVGTESAPRFALLAMVIEGRALDEEAVDAQTARVDAFLERVRSRSPRQQGRVMEIPAAHRRDVRPCR